MGFRDWGMYKIGLLPAFFEHFKYFLWSWHLLAPVSATRKLASLKMCFFFCLFHSFPAALSDTVSRYLPADHVIHGYGHLSARLWELEILLGSRLPARPSEACSSHMAALPTLAVTGRPVVHDCHHEPGLLHLHEPPAHLIRGHGQSLPLPWPPTWGEHWAIHW